MSLHASITSCVKLCVSRSTPEGTSPQLGSSLRHSHTSQGLHQLRLDGLPVGLLLSILLEEALPLRAVQFLEVSQAPRRRQSFSLRFLQEWQSCFSWSALALRLLGLQCLRGEVGHLCLLGCHAIGKVLEARLEARRRGWPKALEPDAAAKQQEVERLCSP